MRVADKKITGTYNPNERSGGGGKLGPGGRAKVIEYILEGRTNRQINLLLVRDGVLRQGDSLSSRTYADIRNLPNAKVDIAKLTAEAVSAGSSAVSRMVVGYVELWDQTIEKVLGQNIEEISAPKLASYAKILADASECIIGIFAPNLSDRVREEIDKLRTAKQTAEQDSNYHRDALHHVTETITRYLKGDIGREQAMAKVGEFVIPATDVAVEGAEEAAS
jgi:hypothetical protein